MTPLRFLSSIICIWIISCFATEAAAETCHHLAVVEIKIGSEHCGYLDRDRKLSALKAACTLADQQQEALKKEVQNSSSTCHSTDCQAMWQRWENTYTHVISQNCWTECGWAWVVDCDSPQPEESTDELLENGKREQEKQDPESS
jgi:hypothetical protein